MTTGNANNPQQAQMSDESMLRTLLAQAEAIWPQERELLLSYQLPASTRILDVGCGPGEISARLLDLFPTATLLGIDLEEPHLERARARCPSSRARFEVGDALELDFPADSFDLSVCRHLLQAVPDPRRVVANMARVTAPGGRVHCVAEDYAMMHFWPTRNNIDAFWQSGPIAFASATGTDLRSGRKIFSYMIELELEDVRVDMVTIDTVRVPRETFAQIWIAWRDGYAGAISANTDLDGAHVLDCFNDMIECIRNRAGYGVWQLPVISGRV